MIVYDLDSSCVSCFKCSVTSETVKPLIIGSHSPISTMDRWQWFTMTLHHKTAVLLMIPTHFHMVLQLCHRFGMIVRSHIQRTWITRGHWRIPTCWFMITCEVVYKWYSPKVTVSLPKKNEGVPTIHGQPFLPCIGGVSSPMKGIWFNQALCLDCNKVFITAHFISLTACQDCWWLLVYSPDRICTGAFDEGPALMFGLIFVYQCICKANLVQFWCWFSTGSVIWWIEVSGWWSVEQGSENIEDALNSEPLGRQTSAVQTWAWQNCRPGSLTTHKKIMVIPLYGHQPAYHILHYIFMYARSWEHRP